MVAQREYCSKIFITLDLLELHMKVYFFPSNCFSFLDCNVKKL